MKYGIVENNKFILIDDDLQRLKNTLPFMPQYSIEQIGTYYEDQIEQGYDGAWYEKGHAPQRPLEEAKAAKLAELKTAFQNTRETAHCMCALGFEIDANETAYINVLGLVDRMSDDETKMFRAYDNTFHEVTKDDVKIIKITIETNAEMLYQNKWIKENEINQVSSVEELNEISLEF